MGDGNVHDAWIDRIVSEHGQTILRDFDPAGQPAISFNADAWLKWNPGDCDVKSALVTYQAGIRRQHLRSLAKEMDTTASRRRAFVATLLWGAGSTNRYYGRHSRALADDRLDAMLAESVASVGAGDLAKGWSAIHPLPGLGFRFFTKWLWLAGVAAETETSPPLADEAVVRTSLVYDQRVINSLAKT